MCSDNTTTPLNRLIKFAGDNYCQAENVCLLVVTENVTLVFGLLTLLIKSYGFVLAYMLLLLKYYESIFLVNSKL